MTDERRNLEHALRRALRPVDPGQAFADAVLRRIERPTESQIEHCDSDAILSSINRRRFSMRLWVPAALAACAVAGMGLMHWRQEALNHQRGLQARAQLLQALAIANENIDAMRATVLQEEQSKL